MALGSCSALAQLPGIGGAFSAPLEADSLPEELTVIDGFRDPAPKLPVDFSAGALEADERAPFEEPLLSPVETISSGGWLRNGFSYVEADVVLLQHNAHDKVKLSSDATLGSNRTLNVGQGELGLAANLRLNIGQNLFRDEMNRDHAVEFMFYGLGNWEAEDSLVSANANFLASAIDPFIGGFNGANEQTFRYASDFDSYEINYRLSWRLGRDQMVLQPGGDWVRQVAPGTLISVLAGLRVAQIDERFNYTSVSTLPNVRRGQLVIRTSNDLVGGQLGALWMQQFSHWNWGVSGKAGAYVNFTSMTSDLKTVDPVLLELNRHDRAEDDVLSFLGELSVFARYHLRPNASMRVAYEAMFFNQIAQAPEQINLTPAPLREVETGGAPFYMGLSCGFEATW